MHGQGLYDSLFAVEVAEDAFIDRAACRKTETGIETVTHVRHILMTQQLEDDTRYDGHTALAVVSLFELAACPFGSQGTQVLGDLGLYPVA